MAEKEFLSAQELAEFLSIKVKTIYGWTDAGKIPAYKINGILRFKFSEISEFIKKGRVHAVDPEKMMRKIIGKQFKIGHNPLDSDQKMPR